MSFIRLDADHWRDYASMNQWVVRASLPALSMEFAGEWAERARTGRAYAFSRVILADRSAAMLGYNWRRTQRTASNPFALPGSVHWWAPLRNAVVNFANVGVPPPADPNQPVITYISRQGWGRRMLIEKDHEGLVRELHRLRDEKGYEVNIVSMDKLSRVEQLQLAGRTTVCFVFSVLCLRTQTTSDHDGRARERSDVPPLDAAKRTFDCDGVLLPRRFRARLRVDDAGRRHGPLRLLGEQGVHAAERPAGCVPGGLPGK
jgi:hypothetical protein